MSRISRRVSSITESATLAVDARFKALRAAGENVIGFTVGEPDFPTPQHVVEAAVAACRLERYHHYTPTAGLPELREAIALKTKRDSGYDVRSAQVLVTNGGKHALYNTFAAILDPGDEVLLPVPYWTTYPESIALAGGCPVPVLTDEASGFRATVDQLEAATSPRTKALVFVSPSNPTGAVYARDEAEAIGRWAAARGLWVIADEIYEHLVYQGHEFNSMPVLVPELRDRCIVINGVAKTYAMTGWRVGWLIGPPDVVDAAQNLQSHSTSNVSNIAQAAALAAVSGDLEAVAEMRFAFERRRRMMHEMLTATTGVTCFEPEGAFYCFPSFAAVVGETIGGRHIGSTLDLASALLEEERVAVVPGEAFGAPGYARLSYALGDNDLVEGLDRIRRFLES